MYSIIYIGRQTARALRVIAVGALTLSFGVGQTSSTITVNDPRALAQAALQLERQVGIAVNYEDVPYAYSGDISDVTDSVMTAAQKAAHPGAHILIPRGGQISSNLVQVPGFALKSLSNLPSIASASPLVSAIIAQNSTQGLPGNYTSTSLNGAFYIVPAQFRNASGVMTNVTPALDATITLPAAERSAADTLDLVLQQASQVAGVNIALGGAPAGLLATSRVTISAANEAARSVLGRLFLTLASQKMPDGSAASRLAYHLYYDPGLKYYLLNVHGVPGSQPSSAPAQPQPPAVTSSVPNPYVKKK
jgi:hypothetical protein